MSKKECKSAGMTHVLEDPEASHESDLMSGLKILAVVILILLMLGMQLPFQGVRSIFGQYDSK